MIQSSSEADYTIALETIDRTEIAFAGLSKADDEADDEAGADPLTRVLVGRQWIVPCIPLWHSADDATELLENDSDAVRFLPADSVRPPLRGLAVDGMYPDHPDYPLTIDSYLSVHGPPEQEISRTLVEWASAVEISIDPPEIGWIAAVGDVMPGRGVDRLLAQPGGIDVVFGNVLPAMRRPDVLIRNLEGAVTTRGTRAVKSYTFRFPPDILPPLAEAGFTYLSVTNDHSFDWGLVGFTDILEHLRQAGIPTSGAGGSAAEACAPWKTTIGAVRVSVLSFGAYPRERNGVDGLTMTAAGEARPGVAWYETIASLPPGSV